MNGNRTCSACTTTLEKKKKKLSVAVKNFLIQTKKNVCLIFRDNIPMSMANVTGMFLTS